MGTPQIDAGTRRNRKFRTPTGTRVRITERTLTVLEALHHFGQLPTTYLYHFQSHIASDRTGFTKHMGKLFHERAFSFAGASINLPEGQGLVGRSARKGRVDNPLSSEEIYFIEPAGEEVLRRAARFVENAFQPSGPWLHQFMCSCIMASFAIEARAKEGLRFIHQSELINEAQPVFRFGGNEQTLRPDGLCALERRGRRFYLFLEADRTTEPIRTRSGVCFSRRRNVWSEKLHLYRMLFEMSGVERQIGLAGPQVAFLLNITTNETHMHNQIEAVKKFSPELTNRILGQWYPEFCESDRVNFKVPKVLPVLSKAWRTGGGEYVLVK